MKIPIYLEAMHQKPKPRIKIKPETAVIIELIGVLILLAAFVWERFFAK